MDDRRRPEWQRENMGHSRMLVAGVYLINQFVVYPGFHQDTSGLLAQHEVQGLFNLAPTIHHQSLAGDILAVQ